MKEFEPQTPPLAGDLVCPLCADNQPKQSVRGADARRYQLCGNCALIFADPVHHLSAEAEQAFYACHDNSIENQGYVDFLKRLVEPMLQHLSLQHSEPQGSKIPRRALDYGCGPGPTLSLLVRQAGVACDDYDPLFFPRDFSKLAHAYDAVFATECFEHFYRPEQEINTIAGLLKPGALLGIMTELWTSRDAFAAWYYTKDPTHVCFFHQQTIEYICERFGFERMWEDGKRVVVLRKLFREDGYEDREKLSRIATACEK